MTNKIGGLPAPGLPAEVPAAPAPATQDEAANTAEMLAEALAQAQKEQETLLAGLRENADQMAFTSSSYQARFAGVATQKPKDNAAALTARLVMAGTAFQVQSIAAEAGSDLVSLRATAAMGKGETAQLAKACIAKLEKVIIRCRRKVRDLDNEDLIHRRQKRAEEENQQKRAERIKQELRKKRSLRASRENAWLQDANKAGPHGRVRDEAEQQQIDQAVELAISAEAAAIAAMEVAIEAAMPEGGGSEVAVAVDAGGGGGAEGGEAAGASMDISV